MKIVDKLNRSLRDLRISVMDRCNLRCTYCMPKEIFGTDYAFLPTDKLLTFEEIERIVSIFTSLGVEKIRLTGGEPLLRKEIPSLIQRILNISGVKDLSLTTNGIHLGMLAKELKESGLKRINISLDSLNPIIYGKMNGKNFPVSRVLHSIEEAASVGLKIKINMVIQNGINDLEIIPMAKYCFEKGYTLRFIEFMDVGNTNGWKFDQVYPNKKILETLNQMMPLEPIEPDYRGEVAERYRYKGTNQEVGFISSVTHAFCSDCNRARISADGKLFTCLFASNGFDIQSLLRNENLEDEDIKSELYNIWNNRTDRYSEIRNEVSKLSNKKKIEMSYIGG
ncbi:cyclic pyranopterin monophosphate synthase [Lysinibacillus sp. PLM2]|nr:cyclic pyranopterin monophosphate synthase [Lysinibacillus sp. PLM2]